LKLLWWRKWLYHDENRLVLYDEKELGVMAWVSNWRNGLLGFLIFESVMIPFEKGTL
jgi:hypothetical protein